MRLHHLCLDTGDVGAIYTGRDWTMRGNVVRHNLLHDLAGPGRGGANAVYLDDCASGTTIVGNVFVRAGRAVHIGGGRDNIVRNNIFVDCTPAVHLDQRAKAWAKARILRRQGSWNLFAKLEAVPHDQPPYATRYPRLARILDEDPLAARGNVVERNICVGGTWLDIRRGVSRTLNTIRDNLTDADPRFVDPRKMDFRLTEDSPALRLGFEPIPITKIGIRRDAYRSALPPTQ